MKPEEIIERLCLLQSEVNEHMGWKHSADCFCKKGGFWDMKNPENYYHNEGKALEFIEEAVRKEMMK